MIRKVGGIYFWNIGRVGGSFYIAKRKQARLRLDSVDGLIALLTVADVLIWGSLFI